MSILIIQDRFYMTNQLTEEELLEIIPTVGMGVTKYIGSDEYPFTIIDVISKSEVTIQMDKSIRTDSNGMDESQVYSYEPDSTGDIYTITLRHNGKWIQKTKPTKGSPYFVLGIRRKYYDFSF